MKSNDALNKLTSKKALKKVTKSKIGARKPSTQVDLQKTVAIRSMMKTNGSQRWLITQKVHQGCKLVMPLLFPNDAPVCRHVPVGNLWFKLGALTSN